MHSPETVSIRLIFPAQFRRQFEKLSQNVAAITASRFVLGKQTPPHITLINFYYEGQLIHERRLRSAVTTTGICLLSTNDEECWIGARVKKSRNLVSLREETLAAWGSPQLLRTEFVPHVTLGLISKRIFKTVARAIQNDHLFHFEDIPCTTEAVIYSSETGYRPFSD